MHIHSLGFQDIRRVYDIVEVDIMKIRMELFARPSPQYKCLTSKKCCHVDTNVILGTLCEVVISNFCALNI